MKFLRVLLLLCIVAVQLSAQTTGTLNVSVTTSSTGGTYAPRNIVAIWVEDSTGNFVKTLLAYAERRIEYLYTWKAATTAKGTQYNRVDAVTGATQTSHGTRTCTWNGTDYNKSLVPDGKYYVCMELTDKHAQGNYAKFAFTKGKNNLVTPANANGFSSVSIQWEASGTVNIKETAIENDIQVLPNPSSDIFYVRGENIQGIEVLSLSGSLIFKPENISEIDVNHLKSGIYLLKIRTKSGIIIKKVIKK